MKPELKLLPLAAMLALCAACSYNPNDYSCFSDIDPAQGWRYTSTFVYLPRVEDSICTGQLQLMVRHTNDYPYANLWVELESQHPAKGGHVALRRDTFCITLADAYGNWRGSGLGTSFQVTDTLLGNFTLINEAPLKLRHIMRPDSVTGIEQIGLIFKAYPE